MASRVSRREFRTMLSPGAALLLPGVANALTARIVADQGFAAAYVTGAGIANTFLGVPDIGLVTVTELAEHVAAIRAAFAGPLVVDADTGFGNPLNMVRTVELLERAAAYHDAGADVTFVEAPTTMEQIADIPRRLPWPQLANIVLGGRTPELPNQKLKELGYAGVIYANVALQAAVKGMQAALGELRRKGHMGEATDMVADFSERQRLVHKDDYDALERKYVTER